MGIVKPEPSPDEIDAVVPVVESVGEWRKLRPGGSEADGEPDRARAKKRSSTEDNHDPKVWAEVGFSERAFIRV